MARFKICPSFDIRRKKLKKFFIVPLKDLLSFKVFHHLGRSQPDDHAALLHQPPTLHQTMGLAICSQSIRIRLSHQTKVHCRGVSGRLYDNVITS